MNQSCRDLLERAPCLQAGKPLSHGKNGYWSSTFPGRDHGMLFHIRVLLAAGCYRGKMGALATLHKAMHLFEAQFPNQHILSTREQHFKD